MITKRNILITFAALLNTSVLIPLWLGLMFLYDILEVFEEHYITEKEGIFNFSYMYGSRIFLCIWLALLAIQIFVWTIVLLNKLYPKK